MCELRSEIVPGPALFFIVVNGVPSTASWIMVGDGVIGDQTIQPASTLPASTISAQLVAQYGGVVSRRDEKESGGRWRWGKKRWSLLWDWEG